MNLKPGDKVMFLGIDKERGDSYWYALSDPLVVMQIYTVRGVIEDWGVYLKGKDFHYLMKYFQKVEEEKE